jgi:chromosomal replication initiator protein
VALQGGVFNPRYNFDTFVVGNHNRLAHAAAQSIVEQPGHRFNPLFVYGGVGLGKTHLLHAIGHAMTTQGMQALYCSSEQFTNDLISAIRQQNTEEYRNKYRQVDLLLIDDIQFIGGKESTQEEFFHTFNHLHAGGRQVVISSDRPPKEIATLEARLRSRFEGGLQADISQPDLETRVAILQSKAQSINQTVSIEVLMLIAERVESNIRELEGALNRLIVQASLHNSPLNRAVAEGILDTLVPQRRPREATSVVQIVARHFGLTENDLLGRSRTKEIASARQMAMYLLREENGLSLIHIGELLGGRDHSTVRHGVEKVAQDIDRDEAIRRELVALREKIYEPPGS